MQVCSFDLSLLSVDSPGALAHADEASARQPIGVTSSGFNRWTHSS